MAVRETELTYEVGGVEMRSMFYSDDALTGDLPGVLVYPDARGLDDVARGGARRLAEEGYRALACDFYGEGQYIDNSQEAIAKATALVQQPEQIYANGRAALAAMAAQPGVDGGKVAAMGYCLGGNVAVEIARGGVPLLAAIGFHGGAVPPSETSRNIAGKVLLCLGANDPMIAIPMRNAFEQDMVAAGVDFRLHLYGGVYHSFTNPRAAEVNMPDAVRYDRVAEERSWAETKSLLAEVFG